MREEAQNIRSHPYDLQHRQDNLEDLIHKDFSPIEEIGQIPDNLMEEEACTTFCKELKGVVYKFWLAIFPRDNEENVNYLRNWDLWGPFLIGVLFILIIGSNPVLKQVMTSLCSYSQFFFQVQVWSALISDHWVDKLVTSNRYLCWAIAFSRCSSQPLFSRFQICLQ